MAVLTMMMRSMSVFLNKMNQDEGNSPRWQKSSDEWVKTMDESRRRKNEAQLRHEAKIFGGVPCNHDDLEWCSNCLTTIDGERLVSVP